MKKGKSQKARTALCAAVRGTTTPGTVVPPVATTTGLTTATTTSASVFPELTRPDGLFDQAFILSVRGNLAHGKKRSASGMPGRCVDAR